MSEVVLNVGGETFVLKCTLDAFRVIPAQLGGFVGAYHALTTGDPNTCVFIIAAATGKATDMKAHEHIAGRIFADGLGPAVISKCTEYVLLLQHGGKVRTEAPNGSAGES